MAAKMEKTTTPGVYKRGGRYVIVYRVAGAQRYESFGTLEKARRAKSARTTDIDRGEFRPQSRVTFHEYGIEWIDRYQGNGAHRIRESTREEYRRQLEQYAFKFFDKRLRITELTPGKVDAFGEWLLKQTKPAPTKDDPRRRVPISDATVRRIMAPVQACLRDAARKDVIRSNPASEWKLPRRAVIEDDDEQVKAMTRDELALMLSLVPAEWRIFFEFLAATGLRISEAIALEWRHIELDGSSPHVKVRQALVKGVLGAPKSRHGRRELPIGHGLVIALRKRREATDWPGDRQPVFAASNGKPLNPGNVFRRVLMPAREEACLGWVGFHTFRHTCATILFAEGRNVKQVQKWLGHHSPSFTLDTYVGLLDGDLGEPLALPTVAREATVSTAPLIHA
jgi:integrase